MSAGNFVAITSEGGMIPSDFLHDLVAPGATLEGLSPASYHLAEGERISEQVNRSWNRLKGCWANFRKSIAERKPADPTTTETRERWLQPLFQELGFGQKLSAAKPIEIDGRSYPVSHGWGAVPIHLVGSHVDIDRRTPGAIGAAKASPHSLVQQVLNASDHHMWGIVSNGLVLRLLRDNVTLTRMAYVEWDLAAIFDGDLYSEFFLLWLLCHQSRFEGERPDQCWLENWKKEAADKSFRALEDLRPGVESAISSLGAGLVSHPANKQLLSKLRSGELSTQEFYRQILRVVYRMIFVFAAEDRGLLHPPLPENEPETETAALKARQRYRDFYSLSRLRRRSMHRTGTPHPDLWASFQLITQKLGSENGCPELALPPLGSFLWQGERSTPDLNGCLVSNRHFLFAVHSLAFVKSGGVRRSVDYRNLGAEEIGAVYEGLLELHPRVHAELGTFELDTAAGNERKTSGSYYTPDSLVQCLLDTALDPVVDQVVAGKSGEEAAQAILKLKVCDPAVGSGHFLIAAAHRLARRLAVARTGEEEPSPEANRAALRDVIGRCLYGVDINPMSAELCRVSLWLEALEPGKPLSFLDHRIQVGNSLLGVTPRLLEAGLPDDAFKPIVGDDKAICTEAKKRNKDERRQLALFHGTETAPGKSLGVLPAAMLEVDRIPDDTAAGLHAKEERYAAIVGSNEYLHSWFLADAWCAAFVWKKTKDHPYPITNDILRKIAHNPHDCAPWMRDEIQRLREQYQFFHWHLAFPEIFKLPRKDEMPENQQTGWSGGFDVMLGNPPWERVKLQEKEWFAECRPDIAEAPNAAARKRLVANLTVENPALYAAFTDDLRQAEGESHVLRDSGLYPLCGCGDVNLYAVFAESLRQHVALKGRFGAVLPSGIATDDTTKLFFQTNCETRSLISLFDFENRAGLFPAVDSRMKFCLFTAGSGLVGATDAAEFAFFAHRIEDLRDSDRRFTLSVDDITLLNPNTRTCPVFRSQRDAALTKGIFKRVPVLTRDAVSARQAEDAWGFDYMTKMFDMADSSHEFVDFANIASAGWKRVGLDYIDVGGMPYTPLYEAKHIHIFNHRWGLESSESEGSDDILRNPDASLVTRYWIRRSRVDERLLSKHWRKDWLLGWRDITNTTNERTCIFAVFPRTAAAHTLRVAFVEATAPDAAAFQACLSSFCFDYVARQKVGGTHLTVEALKQLPVLPPAIYAEPCKWVGQPAPPLRDWLLLRVLELTYAAWDLEPFAQDCGFSSPPFVWDEARRFQIRCELDAAFFHLYGLSRDDADYIMDTFPIVMRKDEEKHGTYRTKDTILEIYDAMQTAITTGKPYQTRLDPPPADPRCCHPAKA
jgi:hypothetical protein